MVAVATIGAGVLGAGASMYGSSKAASAQKKAAAQSAALQKEMFEKQVALQEPFRQGGLSAQNELLKLLGLGGDASAAGYGSAAQPFGMDDFQADPGYGFRMSEGMKALDRSAAARGGLLSGAAMKGAQRFGQDLGSQEYMNAFNRYQTERAARLNPLQSMMGSGQTAANTLTGAAGQLGQGLGQAAAAAGGARASGYMSQATALQNALSGGANNYMMYNLLNQNKRPTGTFDENLFQSQYQALPDYSFGG
jgi:hypothetical protein